MQDINYKLKNKSGIYSFLNLVNGKRYVGSSVDLYNRLHEHVHNLKNNKAHNAHFQNAWNKYGEDNFIYNIIEFCDADIRFDREQHYIDSLKPEYNLTLQVVANFGHAVSEECKRKISDTLKRRYANGEIHTYRQDHNWKPAYIYNINNFTLAAQCDCIADALRILYGKSDIGFKEFSCINNTYTISLTKFDNVIDLKNAIYKNLQFKGGGYLIVEYLDGHIEYFRNTKLCANAIGISDSMIRKNKEATKDNPYLPTKAKVKIYRSKEYIPLTGEAVPIEESLELSSSKIGGSPTEGNTEVIEETKESSTPYSIENEPNE